MEDKVMKETVRFRRAAINAILQIVDEEKGVRGYLQHSCRLHDWIELHREELMALARRRHVTKR